MTNTTLHRAIDRKYQPTVRPGACWTPSEESADTYHNNHHDPVLQSISVDLSSLSTVEVDPYNPRYYYAVGDDHQDIERLQAEGVDVITYDDEDLAGQWHRTVRIVSDRASRLFMLAISPLQPT